MPPRSLSRAERADKAKAMIETSSRPFAEIAFAAGFGSVRQFNQTIRELFNATPTHLWRRAQRSPVPRSVSPIKNATCSCLTHAAPNGGPDRGRIEPKRARKAGGTPRRSPHGAPSRSR